jgi:hypothetical protein
MAKELYNFGIPGKQPKVYTLEHKMGLVTPTHKIDVYKRDLRDLKDSQQIKGSDTQYKLNLAKTYLNIAVLEPYENNNNKWKYFGSAAILCKELLSSGTNEEYASTLAMIYENHAIARNTSENKIHYYELALKQYEQLSESHPANAQYKTSLTRIYINMHDLTGVDIYQSKAMQLSKSLTVSDEETLEHINNFIRDVLRSPIDQRAFHCEEAWSLCKKLKIPTKVDDYPVQYLLSLANMYSNMVALFSNTRNYYPGQNMPLPKASLLNHDKDAIRLFIARMSWELRQIKSSNIIKQNEDKILAANSITDPQERNLHIAYYNVIIGMEMAAQAEKTGQFNKAWELLGKISIPEQLDENDTRFFRLVTTYNTLWSPARPDIYIILWLYASP